MSPRTKNANPVQTQMEALAQQVDNQTANEVVRRLNLDNRTGESPGISESEGDNDIPARLREKITVNGRPFWITGGTMQQLFDNYVKEYKNYHAMYVSSLSF